MAVQYQEKRRVQHTIKTRGGNVTIPVDIVYPSNPQDYIDGAGKGVEVRLPSGEVIATTQALSSKNAGNVHLRLTLADQNDPVWDAMAEDMREANPAITSLNANATIAGFNGNFVRQLYTQHGADNTHGLGQADKIISQQRTTQLSAAQLNDLTVNTQIQNNPAAVQSLNLNTNANTNQNNQNNPDPDPDPNALLGATGDGLNNLNFTAKSSSVNFNGGNALYYPKEMAGLREDHIKIVSKRYTPESITTDAQGGFTSAGPLGGVSGGKGVAPGSPEATIYLPIQNGISDTNTVSWGPHSINPIQMLMYKSAYTIIANEPNQTGQNGVEQALSGLQQTAKQALAGGGGNIKNAVASYFSSQAAGVGNMLSRTSGAVFNPNMALLFNNPELRRFSLNFKFTPRNPDESNMIRKIIRALKQTSAVRKDSTNLFLLAPNIFEVSMHMGSSSAIHKAIGQKKVCALVAVNTNYVPDGSYMTFEDGALTSYSLELQFHEVTPLYYDDYENIPEDQIGF